MPRLSNILLLSASAFASVDLVWNWPARLLSSPLWLIVLAAVLLTHAKLSHLARALLIVLMTFTFGRLVTPGLDTPVLASVAEMFLCASMLFNYGGRFQAYFTVALVPVVLSLLLASLSAIYGVDRELIYSPLMTIRTWDLGVMVLLTSHLLTQDPLRWPVNVLASSYASMRLSRYYLVFFSVMPVALGGSVLFMQSLGHVNAEMAATLYVFTSVSVFMLVIFRGATWAHKVNLSRDLAVRRLEEAWRSRETYFRGLVDDSPVILFLTSENGSCTFLSKKWQQYTGRRVIEDLGSGWLECVHPEDRERIGRLTTVDGRREGFSDEYRLRRWDGQYRWVITTGFPRFDDKQNFLGFLGNIIDVHERKIKEDSLRRDKRDAELSNQTKSQFLANMSHEIRTPLNAILGFADLCGDPECSRTERVDYLKRIRLNGDHLLRLIDDILNLAKMESGASLVQKSLFSLERLLDENIASLRALAAQKGLKLEIVHTTELPANVYSDPHRIKQIIINLVGNAIKFTSAGSVRVTTRWNHSKILVTIQDTGIGMSKEQVDNLFKAFSQGDSSVTRKYGGTGLGLHLSRKLAQSIGGDVRLSRSAMNVGSEFEFNFPIGTAEERTLTPTSGRHPTELPTSEPIPAHMLFGKKILVAEDSPDSKELIHLYFRTTGVQLFFASDGYEAYNGVIKHAPDLVLMDVQMPGMDGLEATRRLRHAGYNRPIVALTAHALQDEVDRSFEAGCNYHLTKPVMKEVLLALVSELLQHAPPPTYLRH